MGIVIIIIVIIFFLFYSSDTRKNKHNVSSDYPVTFNPNPVPDKEVYEERKEFLDKKYIPRTGAFDIEVFISIKKPFQIGDQLELAFKKKEAYCQDSFFKVGFKYQDTLFGTMSEYYDSHHPLIRMVRAHFSGYDIIPTIKSIQRRLLTVSIQFTKDGQKIESKVQRRKSTKTRGKFDVVGYLDLSEGVKRVVWKELKKGDQLQLKLDPLDNQSVQVLFQDKKIGWVYEYYNRKSLILQALKANKEIKTICVSNTRSQAYNRASKPDADGNWNDGYLGMVQSVQAKFEMDKK